ncbi:MAG: hypothetical protein V4536_08550 [Pseudomonadota bacterium]
MSFDQDPHEQANISGADLAMMIDEIKVMWAEIEALKAENAELHEWKGDYEQ